MAEKKAGHVWGKPTTAVVDEITATKKATIITEVEEAIKRYKKLSKKVSRVAMRSNRIYMYELIEPEIPEGAKLIKPLIEGKYLEIMYARITLHDNEGKRCTLECQRYNDQWMPLYSGALMQCLNVIENDDGWF